jgi:hypothetical protein
MTGTLYAFTASGGLVLEQGFATIQTLQDVSGGVVNLDMTNVPQISISADVFNAALGKPTPASTVADPSGYFDETTQQYTVAGDKITITAAEILADLRDNGSNADIVSLGQLTNVYTSFETYVQTYFGYFGGFASLFDNASQFDISSDFTPSELYTLMTNEDETDTQGAQKKEMTGSIEIDQVTEAIRFAVDSNVFGNRSPNAASTGDADPAGALGDASANFGMADGFLPGDLIHIANGLELKLDVDVAPEAYLPINNLGPANASVVQQTDAQVGSGTGVLTVNTAATLSNISRTVKCALLIRLK